MQGGGRFRPEDGTPSRRPVPSSTRPRDRSGFRLVLPGLVEFRVEDVEVADHDVFGAVERRPVDGIGEGFGVAGAGDVFFLRTSERVSSDGPMMTGVRTGLPSTWRKTK